MDLHVMSFCTDGGVLVTTTMGLMLHPSLPRRRYSKTSMSSQRCSSRSASVMTRMWLPACAMRLIVRLGVKSRSSKPIARCCRTTSAASCTAAVAVNLAARSQRLVTFRDPR